jgi:hypothetical protein
LKGEIMKKGRFASVAFLFFLGLTGISAAQDKALQYYEAGNTLYIQKNYPQAIRYYDAAIQANPDMWQAYQGMGNCYYTQGDNPKALANYQKCLSLHPDNPSLSSMVQTLREKVKEAQDPPKSKYTEAEAARILKTASGVSDAHFELNPSLGTAFELGGYGLGFGAGLGGFYMFDSEFGIGGMLHLYVFGTSYTTKSTYQNQSFALGTETYTSSLGISSLELVPTVKYKFEGKGIRPYFVAGFGLADLSASSRDTYSYSNGTPYYGSNYNYSNSASAILPIVEGGAGLEFTLDRDTCIFAEGRFDVILGNYGTATYAPVEAGLNFRL